MSIFSPGFYACEKGLLQISSGPQRPSWVEKNMELKHPIALSVQGKPGYLWALLMMLTGKLWGQEGSGEWKGKGIVYLSQT